MSRSRILLVAFGAFLAGAIAAYAGVMAAIFAYWSLAGVHDQDGGGAMAVAYVFAPTVAVIIGTLAAIAVTLWLMRRRATSPAVPEERGRRDRRLLSAVIGLVAGLVIGWLLANGAQAVLKPFIFESRLIFRMFEAAHMVLPVLGGLAGIAAGYRFTR